MQHSSQAPRTHQPPCSSRHFLQDSCLAEDPVTVCHAVTIVHSERSDS